MRIMKYVLIYAALAGIGALIGWYGVEAFLN